jgi:hypothetical protein
MNWVLTIGLGLVVWLLADLFRPLLHPLFRAGAKLYAPPHGSIALALTWIAAIGLTLWAFTRGPSMPGLATAAAILSIPFALVATAAWRDARLAARDRAKSRLPQN